MRTHIDTLGDNTPKSRRRMRALGAATVDEARSIARTRERAEATRVALAKSKKSPA